VPERLDVTFEPPVREALQLGDMRRVCRIFVETANDILTNKRQSRIAPQREKELGRLHASMTTLYGNAYPNESKVPTFVEDKVAFTRHQNMRRAMGTVGERIRYVAWEGQDSHHLRRMLLLILGGIAASELIGIGTALLTLPRKYKPAQYDGQYRQQAKEKAIYWRWLAGGFMGLVAGCFVGGFAAYRYDVRSQVYDVTPHAPIPSIICEE
jgi:hypothetical protein